MSTEYEILNAQYERIKAKQERKARNAVIEEIAAHWDSLSVLRKMWSGGDAAKSIRDMKDTDK